MANITLSFVLRMTLFANSAIVSEEMWRCF